MLAESRCRLIGVKVTSLIKTESQAMKLQHILIALICSSLLLVPSFAEDESGPMLASLPITPDEFFKALGDRYVLKEDFAKKYIDDFAWSGSIGKDAIFSSQTRVKAVGRTEDSIHQINMFVFWSKHSAAELDAVALRDFAFVNTLFKDADVEKWLKENISAKATMEFKGMTLSLNAYLDKMADFRTLSIYIASTKQEPSRVWKIPAGKFEANLLKVTAEFIYVKGSDGAVVKMKKEDLSDEEREWVKANELAE
jgi:hypothetical protein